MVDSILQALSPVLSTEIERIVNETRQIAEAGLAERLQAAETAHRDALEHAVAETRETVRTEVAAEVRQALEAQFHTAMAAREDSFKKAEREWFEERSRLNQQMQQWRHFAEAQAQLMDAASQPEILMRWL